MNGLTQLLAMSFGMTIAFLLMFPGSSTAQETQGDEQSWTLSGDLRLRGAMDRDRRSNPDRERMRLRLRVGAEGALGEGFTVGARLVTEPNPNDPNSPYIDFGQGFQRARFAFDRVYVRWDVPTAASLTVWAGKFQNPLRMPAGYSEMVWDADVHPEGIAAVFEPVPELRLTAGGFFLLTRGNDSDVNYFVVQAATRLKPADDVRMDVALGGYFYGKFDASATEAFADQNQGNQLIFDADGDPIGFASDFDVIHAHGAVTYSGFKFPIRASAEYVVNGSAADGLDDDAIALGATLGGLGSVGSWSLEYRYQDVGQESVFSAVVQDDFLDATNHIAHLAGVSVQYQMFARARLWTLWSRRPGEDEFQKRLRLDLDFNWRVQ